MSDPDPFAEAELRDLVPAVIGILVSRGADFATAEDAVQDALIEALRTWPTDPPRDRRGWLVTVAWRKFLDAIRSAGSRTRREERVMASGLAAPAASAEPGAEEVPNTDDTLDLYFLCAHPDLSASSAVALTLRAVGGLTTKQIADAYMVPESTMAQRISRAKNTIAGSRLNRPGELSAVLATLYLVFNEGHTGDVDLVAEAIRLARTLRTMTNSAEVDGLLALMLLHHARRDARFDADGRLITLADQDRTLWDRRLIAEGIGILQAALACDELGSYQAQAAIAALHADAQHVDDTDWVQIVGWYDELLGLRDTPIIRLNRAVAIGEADGPAAGLAELQRIDESLPRYFAVEAHLRDRAGETKRAADLYSKAAELAGSVAERDHLTRQAARARAGRKPPN
ncbi:RNA polymerase sigma factor [Brevibacterium spongiae]|uniref:Sigma-70 family RNA polymerase sigma factor n=1 Tax=Brevibacterium spongiae TaxID=2909672 RepID=A0ABY5SSY1_9MICO|nr:sigma-70 family RNA polymerase sigma factor [Brevibacterium spongiae]UVI36986.1 sigma-70 family RNA polymerase sigma factor [Brevibacterium spongiae]